jgi:hypothetical protein
LYIWFNETNSAPEGKTMKDYSTQGLKNQAARAWAAGAPARNAAEKAQIEAWAARRVAIQPQLDALSARADLLLSHWDAAESTRIDAEIDALLASVHA